MPILGTQFTPLDVIGPDSVLRSAAAREVVGDVMEAITTADSESAARAALVDLLDVPRASSPADR